MFEKVRPHMMIFQNEVSEKVCPSIHVKDFDTKFSGLNEIKIKCARERLLVETSVTTQNFIHSGNLAGASSDISRTPFLCDIRNSNHEYLALGWFGKPKQPNVGR